MDKDPDKKIIVMPDGPYMVFGGVALDEQIIISDEEEYPIEWKKGADHPTEPVYRLCRCGRSSDKPYCDDTHFEAQFDGTETAGDVSYDDIAKDYDGPELTLYDAEELCSGAGFCDRAGGTWQLAMSSDREDREVAAGQVCNCPSGRLVLLDKKTGEFTEPVFESSVSATEGPGEDESGPLWVKGGIPVVSAKGQEYEVRNRVTLCRCGASRNKPFCDASHEKIGFSSKK